MYEGFGFAVQGLHPQTAMLPGYLDHFIGHSGFDEFNDTENNFITIDNDVYALYTDFAELSYNLETQIDVDTFE
jgi:hypothetical protein